MKAVTCLCCEAIIRDGDSGSISLINIIEDITLQGVPAFLPRFAVFLLSEKQDGDLGSNPIRLVILNNEQELVNSDLTVDFGMEDVGSRNRTNIRFAGFLVPNAGDLKIRFLRGDSIYTEYNIRVRVTPVSQTTSAPVPASATSSS